MTFVIVDVESDGPCPGLYSMVCFGAVAIEDSKITKTFYGRTKPISEAYDPEALAISGFSREQHLGFDDPGKVMLDFYSWVKAFPDRSIFVSDNLAYDWQFINYYFHRYVKDNPFGWSGRRIGDIWAGANKNLKKSWKFLRKTPHTHNPVDDARGNAEALLEMFRLFNIKI